MVRMRKISVFLAVLALAAGSAMAATTRRIPAAITASVQGGVLP